MTDKLSERLIEYFTILCENNNFPPVETKLVDNCRALEAEVNHLKAKLSERPEKMEVDHSEVKINIDERIRALEEQSKNLKEQIVGLKELNNGLDYCAEESDRKRKDAEAEVKRLGDYIVELAERSASYQVQVRDTVEAWRREAVRYTEEKDKLETENRSLKKSIKIMAKKSEESDALVEDYGNRLSEAEKHIEKYCKESCSGPWLECDECFCWIFSAKKALGGVK